MATDPDARRVYLHVARLWRHRAEHSKELERLAGIGRVCLLDGEVAVAPGVRCVPAPGHTPGLQVVAVETDVGTAVIGSDCGHLFRNFDEEWPSCLICDLPAWLRSFERVKSLATAGELVFPGHDTLLIDRYPRAGDGVSRLA